MGQRRGKGEKRRWQRAAREGTGAVVPLLVGNTGTAPGRDQAVKSGMQGPSSFSSCA